MSYPWKPAPTATPPRNRQKWFMRLNRRGKQLVVVAALLVAGSGNLGVGLIVEEVQQSRQHNQVGAVSPASDPIAPSVGDACIEPGQIAEAADGTPMVCRNNERAKPTWRPVSEIPGPPPTLAARPEPTATRTSPGTTKPTTIPSTRKLTPSPKQSPRYQQGVHPGAFCKPRGALGYTVRGVRMVCSWQRGDIRARWRQA